jgi:hypothetical protein
MQKFMPVLPLRSVPEAQVYSSGVDFQNSVQWLTESFID